MNRPREEERRQAEALHLLPDERDREIETAARGRSGSVTLALSLLFSAACLLQGSGAWAAFLALTLAGGAAQCFHQYACYRERFYLLPALILSAAAAGLGGWFLWTLQAAGQLSIGRLALFALLCCLLVSLAGLVTLGLFLLWAWIKGLWYKKDSDRWEQYFQSISTLGFLARLSALVSAGIALTAAVSYPLFAALGFPTPLRLSLVFFAGGWIYIFLKFHRKRDLLAAKLLRLKKRS